MPGYIGSSPGASFDLVILVPTSPDLTAVAHSICIEKSVSDMVSQIQKLSLLQAKGNGTGVPQ